jgi:hypothetical protein
MIVLAGCGQRVQPVVQSKVGSGEGTAVRSDAGVGASAWVTACRDAMLRGRAASAVFEPKLATMPVEIEPGDAREQVKATAFPPTWKVAPIYVYATRSADPPKPQPAWLTSARYELGGDHRIARRAVGDVEVTIGLDGWDPRRADQIIAALELELDACFPRAGE